MITRHLPVIVLLFAGCGPGLSDRGSSNAPPDDAATGTGFTLESFDDVAFAFEPPSAALVVDGAGDPNQRPIHVWFVGEGSQIERAYAIGHADEACCTRVSGALFDAATDPSLRERSWLSYGVGDLESRGDAAARRRLGALEQELSRLASAAECKGQLVLHRSSHDEIVRASQAVVALAQAASRAAQAEDRPVMVWYDLPQDTPAFVPALGMRGEGSVPQPVDFTIAASDLAYPKDVVANVSLDGIGQYIAYLRAEIDELNEALVSRRRLDDLEGKPVGYEIREVTYAITNQDPLIGSRIRNAIALLKEFRSIGSILSKLARSERCGDIPTPLASHFDQIDDYLSTNRSAWEAWKRLPLAGGEGTHEIHFVELESPVLMPDLAEQCRLPSAGHLRSQLAQAKSLLKEAKGLQSSPPPDPLPSLIDASLRGWPATFSSTKAEQSYDRWAQQRQPQVHGLVDERLRSQGYGFGMRDIMSYRVLFRAERSDAGYRVTPTYVLNEGFFIVADPSTGIVRYESPNTDENLPTISEEPQSP